MLLEHKGTEDIRMVTALMHYALSKSVRCKNIFSTLLDMSADFSRLFSFLFRTISSYISTKASGYLHCEGGDVYG